MGKHIVGEYQLFICNLSKLISITIDLTIRLSNEASFSVFSKWVKYIIRRILTLLQATKHHFRTSCPKWWILFIYYTLQKQSTSTKVFNLWLASHRAAFLFFRICQNPNLNLKTNQDNLNCSWVWYNYDCSHHPTTTQEFYSSSEDSAVLSKPTQSWTII